jgi:hypothetical protein
MKKLALGCGLVLIVLLIGGAFATWYVYNRAKSAIQTTIAGFTELGKVPDIERQVQNTTTFVPPESGELTADQLARYARVQSQVRQMLGERFKVLDEKHRALMQRLDKQQQTALDLPELVQTYQELAGLYVQGKQAQAQALNAQRFSLSEYRWIQKQAYVAIGLPVMNLDVAKIIDDMKAGRTSDTSPMMITPGGPSGPKSNKTLVAPHQKMLEDNASLAFFGL